MPLTLLPSAEAVLVAWLKAHPDLTPLHGGRVGTKLNATLPAVRVARVGGTPEEPWLDLPLVQVEAWAADQTAADTLARSIIAAMPDVRGAAAGKVRTFAYESGPFWAPDDPQISTNARYIVTVRLLTTT